MSVDMSWRGGLFGIALCLECTLAACGVSGMAAVM